MPLAHYPAEPCVDTSTTQFQASFAQLMQAPPRRLGRYAEQLMAIALQNHPRVKLLAHNLSVRQAMPDGATGRQTLGEFDFLWQDQHTQQLHHWELATKFYLFVPVKELPTDRWANQCVGPNLADRMGDKLAKVISQQLRLSQTPAGQAALNDCLQAHALVSSSAQWLAQLYLTGWMFYAQAPCDAAQLQRPFVHADIQTHHHAGWWCEHTVFAQTAKQTADACWLKLPRPRWLSVARYSADELVRQQHEEGVVGVEDWGQWLDKLYTQVNHARHAPIYLSDGTLTERTRERPAEPVLVAHLQRQTDGMWLEQGRGFVVPDGWEAAAKRFVLKP